VLGHFLPGAEHLQNPHPLVVHFPIAFFYGAAMLYFIAWIARRDSIAWIAFWMLALGLMAGIVAVAEAGDAMPRKSTLFLPKPRSGMAMRAFRFED